MKIIRVESWRVDMRLAEPYAIAYESVERAENLFVRLVTDGKLVGVGCAAPDPGVSGETVAAAATGLDEAA
ncbi:MAG: dipeptide epimerase, partial [Thermoanaerobaculia bacterium]|nr:dipeptide epimerase [Thermoanaerobaculia bacterium]